MLYDPKWEVKTDANVFSLESLIAWLETMPADKEYIWSGSNCLLCQYLEVKGLNKYRYYSEFPIEDRLAIVTPGCGKPTFGAALERARAALMSSADRA
jgi:hypothetical protein